MKHRTLDDDWNPDWDGDPPIKPDSNWMSDRRWLACRHCNQLDCVCRIQPRQYKRDYDWRVISGGIFVILAFALYCVEW